MGGRRRVVVVGLGGVTCGGKTTVARRLLAAYPTATLVCADDYYRPEDWPGYERLPQFGGFRNYDAANAVDYAALTDAVAAATGGARRRGEEAERNGDVLLTSEEKKELDDEKEEGKEQEEGEGEEEEEEKEEGEEQKEEEEKLPPAACLVVVEGILVFNSEPLNRLFHRRYFFTLPHGECARRRGRRRDYDPPCPPGYFDAVVWPLYVSHQEELVRRGVPLCYVDGRRPTDAIVAEMCGDVDAMMAAPEIAVKGCRC
ncbi:PREDICTED: nicotinamide riboside kinase 1-like [Priapulus caudatus]|uniref:Nicotinamide riboside kinase 1-like n=1 Tax=Priapulus caudatus TaxID=37621 RepID=A0ABM1EWA1_PRICU|nr:PREDICTED: nicotinamide riboside kinase 1-like [Priapulus caudatus]